MFVLVACAFANVYITQPVLPMLEAEFAIGPAAASWSVSAVILGIATTTLPIGVLADRFPARRLVLAGGCVVAAAGIVCATTSSFAVLIAMRAIQGAALPALTTCTAAWLARSLPPGTLNVAMGTYVAATVAGGLGGRLLGGWIPPPLDWRAAFASAALALLVATFLAAISLDDSPPRPGLRTTAFSMPHLVVQRGQVLAQLAGFGAFGAFSTVFNYFPFYLAQAPWLLATPTITALYIVYVAGLFAGPFAGTLANRFGNGAVMVGGAIIVAIALLGTLVVALPALVASLIALCAGFFAIHASAIGALNRGASTGRGKANALYTLFYYLGGAAGISAAGILFARFAWPGVLAVALAMTGLPLIVGLTRWRAKA